MTTEIAASGQKKRKLKTYEYVVAGLPIVLVAVGGLIGGAIGGGAFALNVAVFRREKSPWSKYVNSVLILIAGCIAYLVVVASMTAVMKRYRGIT